jgi:hypothetical protein
MSNLPSRKILIITPHYPPSNLAAVHRSRLFARHLPSFGWHPVILTVHERYYEEKLDHDLERLLPDGQEIVKTGAFPVTRPRLIGDIGLRGFFHLWRAALKIIQTSSVDIVYIPIPSFYGALLGRLLHATTGVRYGIDYIDPWVQFFPGSERKFSRHWWSTILSRILEPIAVKRASLITGVAEGYYKGVLDRNPRLADHCLFGAMPYGGEAADHQAVSGLARQPYLFQRNDKLQFVYAGAMLPKAYGPLESIFTAIAANRQDFADVEFHFIGSGKSPNDPEGFNIRPFAERYGLWGSVVFEYPARIPYLDVLVHLEAADAVFILGSTESHYTPSKTYQGVLSGKPILAVLHEESTAVGVLRNTQAGVVLDFAGEAGVANICEKFPQSFAAFRQFAAEFDPRRVDMEAFERYSAREVTRSLALLLDQVTAGGSDQAGKSFHS